MLVNPLQLSFLSTRILLPISLLYQLCLLPAEFYKANLCVLSFSSINHCQDTVRTTEHTVVYYDNSIFTFTVLLNVECRWKDNIENKLPQYTAAQCISFR